MQSLNHLSRNYNIKKILNLDSDEAIRERREFYNNESTRKFLKKDGVPRSKRQARTLVTTGMNKQVDDSLIRLFLHVYLGTYTADKHP